MGHALISRSARAASSGQRHVRVVAHRGASAYAPENTLAAIRKAIARDSDLVEVDVQRSKDGALLLMHDTTLARTTNVQQVFPARPAPWPVSDFTLDEIRRLDAGSWHSTDYAGERVPTLSEAIEVLRLSAVGLQLELKAAAMYPGLATDVAAVMREFRSFVRSAAASNRLVVQSFNEAVLREYSALEPTVPIGLLGTPPRAELPELATWVDQVNPSHCLVNAGYVDAVHSFGMECLMWTVNRVTAMKRARWIGADGIITDRPDVLHRVLHSALTRGSPVSERPGHRTQR